MKEKIMNLISANSGLAAAPFFDCRETKDQIIWKVIQTTFRARMAVQISCPKDEMLWINYESPDGRKRQENVGCEYGVYDK